MNTPTHPARREFLKQGVAALVIAFSVPPLLRFARAAEPEAAAALPAAPPVQAFLRIGSDDRITVLLAHSEMGQGIWTALPMLLAEELGCDWSQIQVEHAPAAAVYAHTAFGAQMTGGSSTTWSEFDRYRKVGAMARDLLVRAAAQRWSVDPATCAVAQGVVSQGAHRARFGELAEAAAQLSANPAVELKPRSAWSLIGKPTRRLDAAAKIRGEAQFGFDLRIDGMLLAMVARAPVFGGKVKSFDASATQAVKGVVAVVQVPSGVAVLAEHYWAAKLGRDALKVEWDETAAAKHDSAAL